MGKWGAVVAGTLALGISLKISLVLIFQFILFEFYRFPKCLKILLPLMFFSVITPTITVKSTSYVFIRVK